MRRSKSRTKVLSKGELTPFSAYPVLIDISSPRVMALSSGTFDPPDERRNNRRTGIRSANSKRSQSRYTDCRRHLPLMGNGISQISSQTFSGKISPKVILSGCSLSQSMNPSRYNIPIRTETQVFVTEYWACWDVPST